MYVLVGHFKQILRFFSVISDASLIANYDVKRCYEVDITFHYRIQGGLTSSTITNTRKTFSDLFNGMSIYLSSLSECSHVTVTRKDIINSPPGVSSVFFRIPLMFTASTSYFITGIPLIYRQFRALIIKNSIRFWNVVIYWFVSLRSLKTLCKAALCDTNRFHVRTQEIISLVAHAQTFDQCTILTEPLT